MEEISLKKHRKHLTIKTLEHGYHDPREMILHAAFQILENFIKEPMFKMIDWQWNEYHQNIYSESMALYHWWKNVRPHRKDPLFAPDVKAPSWKFNRCKDNPKFNELAPSDLTPEEEVRWKQACEESSKFDEACDAEDNAMLKRLIDIRMGMWT